MQITPSIYILDWGAVRVAFYRDGNTEYGPGH